MPDADTLFRQGLPRPEFVNRDPMAITEAAIAEAEALLQRKLYPAQIERLLINLLAYRETGVATALQYTGEQNLVSFASGIHLDYLGELLGVFRLPESPARVRLRFTLDAVPTYPVTIPAGLRVSRSRSGGQIVWKTQTGALIDSSSPQDSEGLPYVEVEAQAESHGVIGNGFLPGEINLLLDDPFPHFLRVENVTQSRQGAAAESDDRLRRRIMLAPEQFAGGSEGAYVFRALSVSPYIVDATVYQETPGHVVLTALTATGVPGDDLLSEIAKAIKPDKRRPLTDWPTVAAPTEIPVTINLTVTPFQWRDRLTLEQEVRGKLTAFVDERLPRLGVDIVPSQIIGAIEEISGVYRVQVNSPTYRKLAVNEWANFSRSFEVTIAEGEAG